MKTSACVWFEWGGDGGKETEKATWVLGKETEALGIFEEDPVTRPGFEPTSTPDTLSLTFLLQNNTLALLNAR